MINYLGLLTGDARAASRWSVEWGRERASRHKYLVHTSGTKGMSALRMSPTQRCLRPERLLESQGVRHLLTDAYVGVHEFSRQESGATHGCKPEQIGVLDVDRAYTC